MDLSPGSAVFLLPSFDGLGHFFIAGGLGVRITQPSETPARRGYEARLPFVGDPAGPPIEVRGDGRLTLHRWAQWISACHLGGVCVGEEDKDRDFHASVQEYVVEEFAGVGTPAGREGCLDRGMRWFR